MDILKRLEKYYIRRESDSLFAKYAKDPDNNELRDLYNAKVREETQMSSNFTHCCPEIKGNSSS